MYSTVVSSARTSAIRSSVARARLFHASPAVSKTVTEKVAEVADKASTVNKKVGKGLASAIDAGEHAVDSTKDTLGTASEKTKEKSHEAAQKTQEAANVAGQKANQAAAGARQGAQDFKQEVKK